MFLWMMPAIIREPAKNEALAAYVRGAVAEDLSEHRPELILIEDRLVPFLFADPRFRGQLERYDRGPRFGTLLSWRLGNPRVAPVRET
jgi:hypothetical protein